MSYELEGKLIEKYNTQQVTDNFRKREFVVEKKELSYGREFIDTIKFQFTQDRCEELDNVQVNTDVKVTFNIKGRKWEKNGEVNYFNNLEAWKIEAVSQQADAADFNQDAPPPSEADFIVSGDDQNDDLPF